MTEINFFSTLPMDFVVCIFKHNVHVALYMLWLVYMLVSNWILMSCCQPPKVTSGQIILCKFHHLKDGWNYKKKKKKVHQFTSVQEGTSQFKRVQALWEAHKNSTLSPKSVFAQYCFYGKGGSSVGSSVGLTKALPSPFKAYCSQLPPPPFFFLQVSLYSKP